MQVDRFCVLGCRVAGPSKDFGRAEPRLPKLLQVGPTRQRAGDSGGPRVHAFQKLRWDRFVYDEIRSDELAAWAQHVYRRGTRSASRSGSARTAWCSYTTTRAAGTRARARTMPTSPIGCGPPQTSWACWRGTMSLSPQAGTTRSSRRGGGGGDGTTCSADGERAAVATDVSNRCRHEGTNVRDTKDFTRAPPVM